MPRPRRDPARDETESQRPRARIPAGGGDLIHRELIGCMLIFVNLQILFAILINEIGHLLHVSGSLQMV